MRRQWLTAARKVGWALLSVAVLLVGVWVVVHAAWAHSDDVFTRWVGWANIHALWVGGLGIALVAADRFAAHGARTVDAGRASLGEHVLTNLVARMEQQWAHEVVMRQVTRPAPVIVRWSSTGRPAASRDAVLGTKTGASWQDIPLTGNINTVASEFLALPRQQLMVLGAPGSGKSTLAMLLCLELLRRKDPALPVPVLLPISRWDPTEESVAQFVARHLAEDYHAILTAGDGNAIAVANYLVEHSLVMPVLDGLDELPASQHALAVDLLDRYAAMARAMVVTSRANEYEQAVMRGETLLSTTAVVELQPVDVQAAITFLADRELARRRWEPVFATLRDHPREPLATALSSPLMISLARTDYSTPDSRPSELLSLSNRGAVDARLLEAYVSAVYDPSNINQDLAAAESGHKASRYRFYPPARATRYLGCLAHHLHETGTQDLRWWQLKPDLLAPRQRLATIFTSVAVVLVVATCTGLFAAALTGRWVTTALGTCALAAATGAGLWRPLWPNSLPPYVARTYRTPGQHRRVRVLLRAAFGLCCAATTALATGDWLSAAIAGTLILLLPAWSPPPPRGVTTPLVDFQVNRRNIVAAVALSAAPAAAAFAAVNTLMRPHAAVATVVVGVFICSSTAALAAGGWSWARFRLIHARLVVTGYLPIRLSAFLDDAHRRGVLRQAGPVYQFRHARLQDHLDSTVYPLVLRARADSGDWRAAERLASLLAEQGHVDELRTRAKTGDRRAAKRLTDLIEQQRRNDEAMARVQARTRANTSDGYAAERLIDLFAQQGRVNELRARANAGDWRATERLTDLLTQQGRIDEAIGILRTRANAGDWRATERLTNLLARQGRIDELRACADSGDWRTAECFADLLVKLGRLDELHARANAGDWRAAERLVVELAQQNRIDELRHRAKTGDGYAAERLADLLAQRGHVDEAIALVQARTHANARHGYAARRVADLLAVQGRTDEALALLRTRANEGDDNAAERLADLLAQQGYVGELRARADAGDWRATERLADLLAQQGRTDEAIAILRGRANAGDGYAAGQLVDLLAQHGRLNELRIRADVGDRYAAERLANLLDEMSRRNMP